MFWTPKQNMAWKKKQFYCHNIILLCADDGRVEKFPVRMCKRHDDAAKMQNMFTAVQNMCHENRTKTKTVYRIDDTEMTHD